MSEQKGQGWVTHGSPRLRMFSERVFNSLISSASPRLLKKIDAFLSYSTKENMETSVGLESDSQRNLTTSSSSVTVENEELKQRLNNENTLAQHIQGNDVEESVDLNDRNTEIIADVVERVLRLCQDRKIDYEKICLSNGSSEKLLTSFGEQFCMLHHVVKTELCAHLSKTSQPKETVECNLVAVNDIPFKTNIETLHGGDDFGAVRTSDCSILDDIISQDLISEYARIGIEAASIDLQLKYDLEVESLKVHVIRVFDVTNLRDNNKLIDSFLKLGIYQKEGKKKRTRIARKSRDPVFNETFELHGIDSALIHSTCLSIQLYQKCGLFKSELLGQTLIWLDDYDLLEEDGITLTEIFQPSIWADL